MNTLSTVAAIAVFSFEEVKRLMWPALGLAVSTEFPGLILERMEAAVLAIWFLVMHTAIGNLYFSAAKIVQEYFRLPHHQWVVLAMFPFLLILALWPKARSPGVRVDADPRVHQRLFLARRAGCFCCRWPSRRKPKPSKTGEMKRASN